MIEQWLLMAGKITFWGGFVFFLGSPFYIPKSAYQRWKKYRVDIEYDFYLVIRGFDFFFLVCGLVIMAYLLWWR